MAASLPLRDTAAMPLTSSGSASQPATPREPTLGEALARRRAEVRVLRLERVLSALRDRQKHYEDAGTVPPPLRAAIRDFSSELEHARAELTSADLQPST